MATNTAQFSYCPHCKSNVRVTTVRSPFFWFLLLAVIPILIAYSIARISVDSLVLAVLIAFALYFFKTKKCVFCGTKGRRLERPQSKADLIADLD